VTNLVAIVSIVLTYPNWWAARMQPFPLIFFMATKTYCPFLNLISPFLTQKPWGSSPRYDKKLYKTKEPGAEFRTYLQKGKRGGGDGGVSRIQNKPQEETESKKTELNTKENYKLSSHKLIISLLSS